MTRKIFWGALCGLVLASLLFSLFVPISITTNGTSVPAVGFLALSLQSPHASAQCPPGDGCDTSPSSGNPTPTPGPSTPTPCAPGTSGSSCQNGTPIGGQNIQSPTNPQPVILTLPNPLNTNGNGCSTISCVAQQVISILTTIAVPIVAIMVLVGAFQITTAAGDPEKFKTGLKTIEYAAIGFAVLLLSGAVANIISNIL